MSAARERAVADGAVLGRHRVLGKIAEGAMAVLYLGEHVETGAPVALKVMRGTLAANPTIHARFTREAVVMGRLSGHEHVARVHDIGTLEDGRRYMAMELVRGCDLAEVMLQQRESGEPFPIGTATRLLRGIAAGLTAVHAANVVHRDVTPANVMVAQQLGAHEGDAKLVDFGISADLGEEGLAADLTAGAVMGTPEYMAPEQAAGAPAKPGFDVFAWGVIAYEMLAGARPSVTELRSGRVAPLLGRRPDVPEALSELVAAALAIDVDVRVASARALVRALDAVIDTSTHAAVASKRWGKSRPRPTAGVIGDPRMAGDPGSSPIETPARITVVPANASASELPPAQLAEVTRLLEERPFDPDRRDAIPRAHLQAVFEALGGVNGHGPTGTAATDPGESSLPTSEALPQTDTPRPRAHRERMVEVTELSPRAGAIVVSDAARSRTGDTDPVVAVPSGLTQLVPRQAVAQVLAVAAVAEAAAAEPTLDVPASAERSATQADGATAPRRWLPGIIALALAGLGAMWWIDREPATDSELDPRGDVTPAAASGAHQPKPASLEPAPRPTSVVAPSIPAPQHEAPKATPEASAPAPALEVPAPPEATPAPTPATKPKPAPQPKPDEAATKPSASLRDAGSVGPRPGDAACVEARRAAADAEARGDFDAVLRSLEPRACWADRRTHRRLHVIALAQTGQYARCVAVAAGSRNRVVEDYAATCAAQIGTPP